MALLTFGEAEATREKVRKINDRAVRRGWTGRLGVEVTPREVTTRNPFGFEITETQYETVITGEAPKYGDWTLLAAYDFDPEAGLITRPAPGGQGVEIDRSKLREGWCDHCQVHRHRNRTFGVYNTVTGEQRQVGSTCIRDFLGWSAQPVFLSTDDVDRELGGISGGGYGERRWDVISVLSVAWAVVKAFGYVKADSWDPGKPPTKDLVSKILDPFTTADRDLAASLASHVDESAAFAAKVRAWVLSDGFSGGGEYVINLKNVAAASTVSPRNIGILVSAISVYNREQAREVQRQQDSAELINEWFGHEGDKIQIVAELRGFSPLPGGQWGPTYLYTFVATEGVAKGRTFKWFASRPALGEETGGTYTLAGTIKKHENYQNRYKSTHLTRVKKL